MTFQGFTRRTDIEIPEVEDIDVDQYFTKEELVNIHDYEKFRYKNIVRNYLTMLSFGLPVTKPEFMNGPRRRKRPPAPPPDSDSEEEDWTPSLERRKEKEKFPPPPPKFVPPKKPIFGKRKVAEKKEQNKEQNEQKKTAKKKRVVENQPSKRQASMPSATVSRPPDSPGGRKGKIMMAALPTVKDGMKKEQNPSASAARYPKRSIERKNYKELEVPDEDIFLFCEDCQKEYLGDCPVHGPLTVINDKEVPPTKKVDPDRAKKTIPDGLNITESKIPGAGLGVISNTVIPDGVRFGPYGGVVEYDMDKAQESGYSWQIYKDGKPHHYIDASDPSKSNWMRYCNCARTEQEQNLMAFQYQGEIYYKTIGIISPGQELLVWYGEDYAKEMGIDSKQEERRDRRGDFAFFVSSQATYHCPFCILSMPYKLPNTLLTHVTKKHLDVDPIKVSTLVKDLYQKHKEIAQKRTEEFRGRKVESIDDSGESELGHQFSSGDGLCHKKRCSSGQAGCDAERGANHVLHVSVSCSETKCEKSFCCDNDKSNRERSFVENVQCNDKCKNHSPCCGEKGIANGKQEHRCGYCDKNFRYKHVLQQHIRIHTGDKPFKCPQCHKTFNWGGHLQTHLRIHTGVKPFKCQQCDKAFNQSGDLQKHLRIHAGEKPYKCPQCDKAFTLSHHLQGHLRIHTGDKPFKCPQCDKAFAVSNNLQRHLKIHTDEKPTKNRRWRDISIQKGDEHEALNEQ